MQQKMETRDAWGVTTLAVDRERKGVGGDGGGGCGSS